MYLLFAILVGRPDRIPGPPEPPEAEVQSLVLRSRGGDTEAMGALYEFYVERVYRSVRPLCGSAAATEDVVQDAFVKAFASLHGYEKRDNQRFIAWLSTIALNGARNQSARGRRRRELRERDAAREVTEAPRTPESALLDAEARGRLLRALEALPKRDREVLSLRYGADLEASEVAAACALSAANVRKICERQRRRLLAELTIRNDEDEAARAGEDP
ncbi:MAG: hypothetical protein DRJ42_00175 [Deltaproteobacteria bacterium]|nr:MAG: hypothetical protein DRJ42_00175 [Deltaproteobacteria bacterium]